MGRARRRRRRPRRARPANAGFTARLSILDDALAAVILASCAAFALRASAALAAFSASLASFARRVSSRLAASPRRDSVEKRRRARRPRAATRVPSLATRRQFGFARQLARERVASAHLARLANSLGRPHLRASRIASPLDLGVERALGLGV